jgi:hypothetical protein
LQICTSDGQKLNTQTCSNICDATGRQCDVCTPGTSRCDKEHLFKCSNDGQMEADTKCATAALCNAGMQRCDTPACAVGEMNCNGAQPQKCNADRTAFEPVGMPCASAPLCVGGVCNAKTCTANEVDCNGTTLRQCNSTSSAWVTLDTCSTPELCDETMGGHCNTAACAAGAYRCTTAGGLQKCNAGRTDWADVMACGSAALCDATAGVCRACMANAYHCDDKNLQKCKADGSGWDPVMTCASAALCDEAGQQCDDCKAPAFTCTNNALSTCDSTGHFGTPVDCGTDTCDAAAGMCVPVSSGGGSPG